MFRLRCGSKQIAEKYFAEESKKGRVEFVPVEWRSSLKLDEGVIDLVTPHTVRGVRNVINTSMMDIMYYTSPFYREEVSVYYFCLAVIAGGRGEGDQGLFPSENFAFSKPQTRRAFSVFPVTNFD